MAEERHVWNFAFGSNVNIKSMRRRGCKPQESKPGILNDYALKFNHQGFPFAEPSFANIEASQGTCVHGVLHKLTPKDWQHLIQTEGGGGNAEAQGYCTVEVAVKAYDGEEITAYAFQTCTEGRHKKEGPTTYPSKRYMGLIINGAKESGIEENYIKNVLEKQPTYNSTIFSKLIALISLLVLFPFFFLPFVILIRLGFKAVFFHRMAKHLKIFFWGLQDTISGTNNSTEKEEEKE